ncbi:hypothetical protein ACTWLT_30620 [Micromonospora sp. ZYX-F-536]|uniref:hypothetical protein n=1 Tax=Micromonospora sp. ZYX-F-536 TaxID=3457629 RepID=UPI0040409D25
MRFVRAIAGVLLLVIGIPALFAGGALWLVTRHADPGGTFAARFETVRTPGHAVVVTDLDRLLRQEAPFARTAQTRLRLDARTPDGPAFVGLAPTAEVRRFLEPVPHASVRRVALARGPLPVRTDPAGPAAGAPAAVASPTPLGRPFWVREGIGSLEWSADDLAGEPMSLVVMRPDGGNDLALDLRAELRAAWTTPATWGLLAVGVLLVVCAVLLLLRPLRPREVVFVVEPDQVPVLAGRLGVSSLSGLGVPPAGDTAATRSLPAGRQLTSVGSSLGERAIAAVPTRPTSLADLDPPARLPRPPEVALSLAWPPATPEPTARPVAVDGTAGGPPRCRRGGPPSPGDRCYPSDA